MIKIIRSIFYKLPISLRIRILKRVTLLYHNAGYGDSFMVAHIAKEIKELYGNSIEITVNGVKKDILTNNPYIDKIDNNYNGIDLNYHYGKYNIGKFFDNSLLRTMGKKVGLKDLNNTVEIFLTKKELSDANKLLENFKYPIVTIQTTSGGFDSGRKLWPIEYWNELAETLKNKHITVLQLGGNKDIPINNAVHFMNKLTIRQSIAVLKNVNLHIGIVSSLMHASEAVKTPAIILFGGFERYTAHNYSNITPLESYIECSPCGLANTNMTNCNNNMCMKNITPNIVVNTVLKKLKEQRGY